MYGRFFLLLLVMGGAWGWQHKVEVKRWWRSHAGEAVAAPGVQVYTAAGCDICERAAVLIESAGMAVTRRAVDSDESARAEFEDEGGSLPLIVDGNRRMNGYSEELLRSWYLERPRNRERLDRAGVYLTGGERLPVIYGTDWCGVCAEARKYFHDNGIAFRDLDIERDGEARRQYDMLGLPGVPVVVYEDMIWNGFSAQLMDVRRAWVGAR